MAAAQQLSQRQFAVLCLCVSLYACAFMAQAPTLPYVVKQLGASSTYYGALQTLFSVLQLAGGMLSGPLVDRYGGRALLLVSFAASTVCYALTATARSIPMLFASRLATLLQHAVLAARTLVAHSCPESERAALLGRIGASYGLGMAAGPAVGGLLSAISLPATAWAAAAASLVALAVVACGLPSDAPQQEPQPAASGGASKLSFASLAAFVRCPGVPALLLLQAGANMAGALMQTTFTLVLQQRFGLSSRDNGLLLSFVGGCVVLAQALLIKPASRRFGEAATVRTACLLLVPTFLAMGAAQQLWQLLVCLVPLAACTVLIGTLNTARLSKSVAKQQAGTALAVDMSLGSGCRALAPLPGAWLMQHHGYQAVTAAAAAVMLAGLAASSCLPGGTTPERPRSKAAAVDGKQD